MKRGAFQSLLLAAWLIAVFLRNGMGAFPHLRGAESQRRSAAAGLFPGSGRVVSVVTDGPWEGGYRRVRWRAQPSPEFGVGICCA